MSRASGKIFGNSTKPKISITFDRELFDFILSVAKDNSMAFGEVARIFVSVGANAHKERRAKRKAAP